MREELINFKISIIQKGCTAETTININTQHTGVCPFDLLN